MGRQLNHRKLDGGSKKHDQYTGCIAGMLHVLDYHHWGNKHRKRKPAVCWRKPRTHSMGQHDIGETKPFLDSDAGELQADEQRTLKPSSKVGQSEKLMAQEKYLKGEINKELSSKQVKEYIDILEVFNVNKEVFIRILKESDIGSAKQFHVNPTPSRLIKSGTFPVPGSLHASSLRPSRTLEHKQKECWSVPRGENLVLTIKLPKFDTPKSPKESYPSHGISELHGWNHAVMNSLKEIKKRIKHAFSDGKRKDKHVPTSVNKTSVSDQVVSRKEPQLMKRTTSLNDSLDRYSQLLESSSRREAKFHSKSLKLTSEDEKGGTKGNHPRFFRRVSSLSGLESLGSFLTELSRDSLSSDVAIRRSVDFGTTIIEAEFQMKIARDETGSGTNFDLPEGLIANGSVKDTARKSEAAETIVEPEEEVEEDRGSNEDQETSSSRSPGREIEQSAVLESGSADNIAGDVENIISKGTDPHSGEIDIDGLKPSLELQSQSVREDPTNPSTNQKQETANEEIFYQHSKLDEEVDACFDYVKNVLELSGFLGDREIGKWHSEDQPLNPSLVKQVESGIHQEKLDNSILFDLVNEAITEVYDKSFTYFPQTFSFTRRIYPMPKGHHLLKEVWRKVRWSLLGFDQHGIDCSLDDIVARDMTKGDGWMNIGVEAELFSLELEELIFDELLDEVISYQSNYTVI